MKRYTNILHDLRAAALGLLAAAGLAACEADPVLQDEGQLPVASGDAAGMLISTVRNAPGEIAISLQYDASKEESEGNVVTDAFAYTLAQPLDHDLTVRFRLDTTLVTPYNDERGFENAFDYDNGRWKTYTRFPAVDPQYVSLSEEGMEITIPAGKTQSAAVPITLGFDKYPIRESTITPLKFGKWLCPVVAEVLEEGTPVSSQTLWYKITVLKDICHWFKPVTDRRKELKDNFTLVLYCNTATLSPTIVNKLGGNQTDVSDWSESEKYYMCDIENLETATVTFNAEQQRAVLTLASDLRYVCEHRAKYIEPVQAVGTKVCLTIQGGGAGIGFCNLNDAQRADLVRQIKNVVTMYRLDGVNLWDKDSGYGADGMPAVDPASYPKFIEALRAALGPDKLITLSDDGVYTANFDKAVEGIEVGTLIDYAWTTALHYPTDPWSTGDTNRKGYKPIAGLRPDQYGSLMFDYSDYKPMEDTETWGSKVNEWGGTETFWLDYTHDAAVATGKIAVGYGMIASLHGTPHEGEPMTTLSIKMIPDAFTTEVTDWDAGTGIYWMLDPPTMYMVLDDLDWPKHSDGNKDW